MLESDLKGVTAAVQRIEIYQTRIEAFVGALATKADVAGLKGGVDTVTARVDAQIGRIDALETANTGTVNLALSKTIGVQGAIVLFVSMAAVMTVVIGVSRHLHFVQ